MFFYASFITLAALLPVALAAETESCDAIPGYFSCPDCKPPTTLYHAAWAPAGFPTAAVQSVGSNPGWSTATLLFSADNLTVVAHFNNGHVGHGAVAGNCMQITWDDKSVWQGGATPPQKIRVHISPHSHDVSFIQCCEGGPILHARTLPLTFKRIYRMWGGTAPTWVISMAASPRE